MKSIGLIYSSKKNVYIRQCEKVKQFVANSNQIFGITNHNCQEPSQPHPSNYGNSNDTMLCMYLFSFQDDQINNKYSFL